MKQGLLSHSCTLWDTDIFADSFSRVALMISTGNRDVPSSDVVSFSILWCYAEDLYALLPPLSHDTHNCHNVSKSELVDCQMSALDHRSALIRQLNTSNKHKARVWVNDLMSHTSFLLTPAANHLKVLFTDFAPRHTVQRQRIRKTPLTHRQRQKTEDTMFWVLTRLHVCDNFSVFTTFFMHKGDYRTTRCRYQVFWGKQTHHKHMLATWD